MNSQDEFRTVYKAVRRFQIARDALAQLTALDDDHAFDVARSAAKIARSAALKKLVATLLKLRVPYSSIARATTSLGAQKHDQYAPNRQKMKAWRISQDVVASIDRSINPAVDPDAQPRAKESDAFKYPRFRARKTYGE